MGFHRAGFEVVGVDIEPQKNYPFEFHQGDAIEFITKHGGEFFLVYGGPPCQAYSATSPLSNGNHPKLIGATRSAMKSTGRPYVIENVIGAPLINPLMLCGTMFGLRVLRHRLFEASPEIWFPPATCKHNGKASSAGRGGGGRRLRGTLENFKFITVVGNDYIAKDGGIAMGIDWMTKAELSQAIPPAYTEWLGQQMLKALGLKADRRSREVADA